MAQKLNPGAISLAFCCIMDLVDDVDTLLVVTAKLEKKSSAPVF